MKERPILFSAEMVRAILEGRKTQTRRIVKHTSGRKISGIQRHEAPLVPNGVAAWSSLDGDDFGASTCSFGQPGDRLWVRETWCETDRSDGTPVVAYRTGGCIAVGREMPDGPDYLIHDYAWPETPYTDVWRPSIHMPRWASRIMLEITGVRVERLQDISETDALAEGVDPAGPVGYITASDRMGRARYQFANLWGSVYGPGAWNANPWVWVVEFTRLPATSHTED